MKGAIDNIENVLSILKKHQINDYHIHCDAALFGGYLPFLKDKPTLDFSLPIDSLTISGYKFIGAPFPCGIMLTRNKPMKSINQKVEYINSLDNTVSGSRSGHAPMVLWYAIEKRGKEGLAKEAETCIDNAKRFNEQLRSLHYPSFLNPYSNTIVLKKPANHLVEKWRLLSEGDWSHIVVMQHVTDEKFENFIRELIAVENL
jgi:histidine decarboxylase